VPRSQAYLSRVTCKDGVMTWETFKGKKIKEPTFFYGHTIKNKKIKNGEQRARERR
jgi:hypothetical protein